jgi:hypothetical protein
LSLVKEAPISVFRNDLEHQIFAEVPTFVAQIPSGVPKVDAVAKFADSRLS